MQSKLDVFGKIPKDKIIQLGNFFDESIILTEPDNSKIRQIVGKDFKNSDIEKVKFIFFDFVMSKTSTEKNFEIINKSQLEEEKKTSIKEMVKKLHAKVDSYKLDEYVSNNENLKNKNAFGDFIKTNLNNPEFKNKFVAFVDGRFQGVGYEKNALIKKMYDKFGNVDMYVHKVTDEKKIILMDGLESL